jgi:hypothetical protein
MIIPLPWSSMPLPFTSIDTTDVSTWCTNLGMLMPLGSIAAPGALVTELMVTPPLLVVLRDAKCPANPPTNAATKSSETRDDQSVRDVRTWDDNGAGSVCTGLVSKMGAGGDGTAAVTGSRGADEADEGDNGVCAASREGSGAVVADTTGATAATGSFAMSGAFRIFGFFETALTFFAVFATGADFFAAALVTLLAGALRAAAFVVALAFFVPVTFLASALAWAPDAFRGTSVLAAGFFFLGLGISVVTEPC